MCNLASYALFKASVYLQLNHSLVESSLRVCISRFYIDAQLIFYGNTFMHEYTIAKKTACGNVKNPGEFVHGV